MNLDNIDHLKELDKSRVYRSLESLSSQIGHVLEEKKNIFIKDEYRDINKVVVNGMGGSNLGARIIRSVFKDVARVPIIIEPGYEIPEYTDDKTLYLLSSYSGNTEETLSVYDKVKQKGAKVVAITSDHEKNELKELMEKEDIPGFVFDPKYNPANQPRLALGYSIFGMIALFSSLGIIELDDAEVEGIQKVLDKNNDILGIASLLEDNKAKRVATKVKEKALIIVASEFLEGNAHTMRNQICENSKNFAHYFSLPEMNHYLLEGLKFPASNKDDLFFLFLESDTYTPRINKRLKLTKEIVIKHGIDTAEFKTTNDSKLNQAFQVLQFGSWFSFYLAALHDIDPAPIPWVDWFKDKLV